MARAELFVDGLDDFRRELKAIDMDRDLGKAHRKVSTFVAEKTERQRSAMASRFGPYRRLDQKIRPSAAKTYAQVNVRGGLGAAAEWGTKIHHVYGRPVLAASMRRRVWPAWSRDGHLVRPVVREHEDEILERYGDEIEDLSRRAFPDRR